MLVTVMMTMPIVNDDDNDNDDEKDEHEDEDEDEDEDADEDEWWMLTGRHHPRRHPGHDHQWW